MTAAQERDGEGRAGVQTRLLKAEASADDQGASCCRNLGRAPGPLREAERRRRCWQLRSAPLPPLPVSCSLRSLRRWSLSRVSLLGFLRGQEMHNPELKLAKMGVTPNLSNQVLKAKSVIFSSSYPEAKVVFWVTACIFPSSGTPMEGGKG